MTKPFAARYNGDCANECGAQIKVGESIIYLDGEPQHSDCTAALPDGPVSACSECFVVSPCFCD